MAEVHSSQEAPKIKLFGKMIALQGRQIKEDQKMNDQGEEEKRPEKIIPCPRCKSMETKFCYFNNYNVNQPRHFCKGCQRYWTAGGALRNVPVGAGRRKAKPPTQGLPGFSDACFFDPSAAHHYDLDIGAVEEWHILAQDGHIFQGKRRRNGELC